MQSWWPSADATRSCSIFRQLRIAEALARRAPLLSRGDLNVVRLFHGDGEGCPGLAVDRFGEVAVIHADTRSLLDEWLPSIHANLSDVKTAYTKVHPRD